MVWISLAVIVTIVAISSSYLLLAIRSISVEMGTKIQYETQKMVSNYNDVVEMKTREIELLDLTKLNNIEMEIEERVKAEIKKEKSKMGSQGSNSLPQGNYCDKKIGYNYSAIRKLTRHCTLDKLDTLISQLINNQGEQLQTNLEEISFDTFYELSHLDKKEQYMILWNSVDEDGKSVIQEYNKKSTELNALDLYDYLQIDRKLNTNQVEVRVSPNLELSSSNKIRGVSYVVDDSLIEGFDVLCKATLYNYSISEKEIN